MPQLLNFAPHFQLEILDSQKIVLFSEDKHHLLSGQIYVEIAKILKKGPIHEKKLFKHLSQFPQQIIRIALDKLKTKRFITFYTDTPKNIAAFWSDMGLETGDVNKKQISVCNFSEQSSLPLKIALNNLSIVVNKPNENTDLFVVIVDNYICKNLEAFNQDRLKDQKPWMLLKPSGRIIWLGPIFKPNTGCWNCLAYRLKENRRVEIDLFGLETEALDISPLTSLPVTNQLAFNLAAMEIAKWEKMNSFHPFYQNLFTFDSGTLEARFHPFKSLSSCHLCQSLNVKKHLQTFDFKPSKKEFIYEDGERACSIDYDF